MTATEEVVFRARLVERLERYRDEINDLRALVTSSHRLVGSVQLSGDMDEADSDGEAVDTTRGLLTIARRTLRLLAAELSEDISRVDQMSTDGIPPASA